MSEPPAVHRNTASERRALLVRRLLDRRASTGAGVRRVSRGAGETYPLSYQQEELWFLHQFDPTSPAYNAPAAYRLTGQLDREALRRALDDLVIRHESLRTTFPAMDGQPVQVVGSPAPMAVSEASAAEVAASGGLVTHLSEVGRRPLDLENGPAVRAHLCELGKEDYVLLLAMHHIVTDARSDAILWRDLWELYESARGGGPVHLPDLSVSCVDFACWQRERLSSGVLDDLRRHWRRALDGVPPLAVGDRRATVWTYGGDKVSFGVAPETADALSRLGREHRATPFMVYLAAFALLLSSASGQDDLAVGTVVSGRNRAEFDEVVGFFVNTLVLRIRLDLVGSFRNLLTHVRDVVLDALAHQEMPFRLLVEMVRPDRDAAGSPLFGVMFAYESETADAPAAPAFRPTVARVGIDLNAAKFDLSLAMGEQGGRVGGVFEYRIGLFHDTTVRTLVRRWEGLLGQIVTDPGCPLGHLVSQQAQIPPDRRFGCGLVTARSGRSVDEVFERVAGAQPDAVAVRYGKEEVSYAGLESRANRIAHHLIDAGVAADAVVALALPRSIDLIASLLAVLKAGAAYLPLDPDYPHARTSMMLADAVPAVGVTTREILRSRADIAAAPVRWVTLDDPATVTALANQPDRGPFESGRRPGRDAEGAAYVVFTSGSTGRPNGVVGLHGGLIDRLAWFAATFPDQRRATVAARTSLNFVDGTTEVLGALLSGGTVALLDAETVRNPLGIAGVLSRDGVDRVTVVPSLLRSLLRDTAGKNLTGCRFWVTSGEEIDEATTAAFRRRLPEATLLNLYGCSEASGDSVYALCRSGSAPLGRPIANTRVYVLDPHGRPVSVGAEGELHIGGSGLARGYLRQAALTAERFLPDPYGPPGSRMYRTGDLVRWTAGGQLEYAGRRDYQVKIRGHRVSLREVETALLTDRSVGAAVAVTDRPEADERRIIAYVVGRTENSVNVEAIRAHLRDTLPHYMVPALIMSLSQLPTTPNGKVDRARLPPLQVRAAGEGARPRSATEEIVSGVFAEVLGVDRLGIDDSFFDFGGHSLSAARLALRLSAVLSRRVEVSDVFRTPTVAGLAARLDVPDEDKLEALLPLRPQGDLLPLFCAPPVLGLSWCFAGLLRYLEPGRPLFGLQSPAILSRRSSVPRSIAELAETYVTWIRSIQPSGPYNLLGWSFGGAVAHEIAVRLQRDGSSIGLLAVMDTYPRQFRPYRDVPSELDVLAAVTGDAGRPADWATAGRTAVAAELRRREPALASLDDGQVDAILDAAATNMALLGDYVPGRLDGSLHFFTADRSRTGPAAGGWDRHVTGTVTVHHLDCTHWEMAQPGPLEEVAAVLLGELPDGGDAGAGNSRAGHR